MSASSRNRKLSARGFTLIETMIAIAVLTIGLISVAALATTMLVTGKRSKYMALAASLASEKLEDLSRYANDVPQVCVPTGSTSAGSLSSDVMQTTTCPSPSTASGSVSYDDDVDIAFGTGNSDCPNQGGCFSETVSSVVAGKTQYTTTYHSPDGEVEAVVSNTATSQKMTFHRRWIIEADTPVAGVRRITVEVTMANNTVQPPVNFQMSAVHP